ncbi:MAG: ABC transporter permease [Candidatus Cloacimonetes bacterium]|nr:ABC transporter permease [Candidatus Cloacimonadota bacterium]
MLKNYIKIALRNLIRHKGFSFINIIGLSIGMAACLIILLFIQKELSYEKMHTEAEQIYRVLTIDKALGTNNQRVGITMPPLGTVLPEAFPEVKDALRLTSGRRTLLAFDDKPAIYAEQLRTADENFFDFFNFPLLQGNPVTALKEPFTVVLTKSLADQLFADEEPLGKTLKTGGNFDLTVTGIMEDLPDNTHLTFDALGSIKTLESLAKANQPENSTRPIWLEEWRMIGMPTYVRFHKGIVVEGFDDKFTQLTRKYEVRENFDITLQPLLEVHLKSTDVIFDPVQNKGDMKNIYIYAAIALLILLIAAVNYMNLSTSKSTERAKEVGMRKVVGSKKSQLVQQFLGESLLITFIALLIAIGLVEISIPLLNDLTGNTMSLNLIFNSIVIGFLLLLLIIVGLLAGFYPAIILSGFKPVTVLKGSFKTGKRGSILRKILVVFQFSLSIALIGMTAVIQRQLSYIQQKNIGYDREQVLIFDMFDRSMNENIETFREELTGHSSFVSVSTSTNIPGRTFGRTGITPEGASEEDIWIWSQFAVSPETIPTLGMEIVQGRNFSREITSDAEGGVVLINETAVKQLGWENPLEKRLFFGQQDSLGTQIVGVVKDFHFIAMHQNIEPVVIYPLINNAGNLLSARINPGQIKEAMQYAKDKWSEIYPDYPFTCSFLDEEFDNLYSRDINTGKIVNIFSFLAIFIACLGLFGLASHTTLQRTKEIGVRKVMGATVGSIVKLLAIDFVKWVLLSNLFAWPLAWFVAKKWLQNFAYKTEIDLWIFVVSGLFALIIAFITISLQTIKAANANPVEALKYE